MRAGARSRGKSRQARYQGRIIGLRYRPCCGTVVVFQCEHPKIQRKVEGSYCRHCEYAGDCMAIGGVSQAKTPGQTLIQ